MKKKNNYKIEVYTIDSDDGLQYYAHYPAIKGISGGGDTPGEAIEVLEEQLEEHLSFLEELGVKKMNNKQSKTPTMQLLEGARRYVLTHMVWFVDTTFAEPRLTDLGELIVNLIDDEIERQTKAQDNPWVGMDEYDEMIKHIGKAFRQTTLNEDCVPEDTGSE